MRRIADELREHKEALGALVSWEMGKIRGEGEGEVQEMIDIADFAVGLSRQLYGLTMASERPRHRMYEQWHPLGPVGIISAFNFPVAVWSWNSFIARCAATRVSGSLRVRPLSAVAVTEISRRVDGWQRVRGVFNLVAGSGSEVGEALINDGRIPLVSATGSNTMGERVAVAVAKRFGRSILELGATTSS